MVINDRSLIFITLALLLSLTEWLFPRKSGPEKRAERWPSHYLLVLLGNLISYFCLPMSLVNFASFVEFKGHGLLNFLDLNDNNAFFILALVLLDFGIYYHHFLFHRISFLWRFHRVHHSDEYLDVSSALRFHPIEIYFSYGYKFLLVFILGPSVLCVTFFEILLSSGALFSHANLKLGKRLDRWLCLFVVTPDFHRIHHSRVSSECNSNYGFFLPWWDYLFKTYTKKEYHDQDKLIIGCNEIKDKRGNSLIRLIVQPFR